MSIMTEKICIEALSLPHDARAELAWRLLTSLEGGDFSDDASEAWRSEISSRRRDFAVGEEEISAGRSVAPR